MRNENPDTGQDSFLDIVANLVGILIILVVVIGAQATSVWTAGVAEEPSTGELAELRDAAELAQEQWRELEIEQREYEARLNDEADLLDELQLQRHRMLVALSEVEQELERSKQQLNQQQRQKLEKLAEVEAARTELARLQESVQAVAAEPETKQETIDHYPTPIAKTVFSDEVHFQLKGNRLVHVPLDALTDRMKAEWKVKAEKLKQLPVTIETVPEIDGFRMQYELAKVVDTIPSEYGVVRRESVQFQQFVLIPTRPDLGEAIESALDASSQFRRHLSDYEPAATTVSIWVYPDSYETFQEVKDWLHEKGYRAAAWPLSEGSFISGSPNGLRSSAQ